MSGLSTLVFVLVALAAGAFFVWNYLQESKRRQALQQFCMAKGWQYTAEDDSFTVRWNGTPFGQGDRRRCRNVVRGTDRGVPFVAFDYQYDTESTDSRGNTQRTTHHFDVVALALPTVLPTLQVTPEGFLERAAEAVGLGGGIDLESEDFNRHFRVHARQPKFASDVLTPRTMEALLAGPPTAWRIEMSDLVSWGSGTMNPVDVLASLSTLHHVVDGIPSFVWHDNGYDPDQQVQSAAPAPSAPPAPASPAPAPPAPQAPQAQQAPVAPAAVPPAEGSSA